MPDVHRPLIAAAIAVVAGIGLVALPASSASAEPRCTTIRTTTLDDPATLAVEHTEAPVCVVRTSSIRIDEAGMAVRVSGRITVDDGGTAGPDELSRYFWRGELVCFTAGAGRVFVTDSGRNLWDGVGAVAVAPGGVFVAPTAGVYTCELRATQINIFHDAVGARSALPDRTWAITGSSLSIARPMRGGASSAGPNGTTSAWPEGRSDVTSADDGTVISQVEFAIDAAATVVDVVGSTQLSSCSFNSDVHAGACSARGAGDFGATLRVFASQRTSPTDASFCGGAANRLQLDIPVRIDPITHHLVIVGSGSFPRLPECTGSVVVKTELWGISGRGYLGTGQGAGLPLTAYSTAVGAVWG